MENLFRTELIAEYNTKNRTAGVGEWTLRNGIWSMDIRPEPFYQNLPSNGSGILKGKFEPLTSYIVDMWIDVDQVTYNGNNVAAGMTLLYTDGSSESFVYTGPNKGWNHKKIITPAAKSINLLNIYYYTSVPVYYRWDSYICKATTENIMKQGQLKTTNTIENQDIVSFSNGGSTYCHGINEY